MTLLLIMTTCFDVITNCLTVVAFKSANIVSVKTVVSYSKCSKCLPPLFTDFLNLFLNPRTAFFCRKDYAMFSPVRLLILYLASVEAFKKVSCIAPQT